MGSAESAKLRDGLARIAAMSLSAAERAEQFRALIFEIEATSDGTWQATEVPADDGGYAFAGRLGEVVVIAPDGAVYRGRLGDWPLTSRGIKIDYSELMRL